MVYKSASQGAASFLVAALDPSLEGMRFVVLVRGMKLIAI